MFRGSMVAVVTPMQADGALDFAALARLVEFHIDNGTDALIAVGTTGESATLDFDEHITVIAKMVELVRRRIPVIAGTGANSTREALHLTERASQVGADACLLVTPYYNKPTQEGLYRHYKLIADSVPIPQILYNVPGRTACDLQPDTVERLADLPNIIGIKEASSLARILELVRRCGDRPARSQPGAPPQPGSRPPLASLETVCTVARHGSFLAAAEVSGVTHGAISRRVAAVENWLGMTLFERHARGVRMTPDGQRVVGRIEQAFAIIDGAATILNGPNPLVVVLENDRAKVLGQSLAVQRGRRDDVVCIDGVHTGLGDYIDIGAPVGAGQAVPVVVKTLVFND